MLSLGRVVARQHGSVFWRTEAASDVPVRFRSGTEAVAWLRSRASGAAARRDLRAALVSIRPSADLGRWSDGEVLVQVGMALAQQTLRAVRAVDVIGLGLSEEVEEERAEKVALTWVEMFVVWADDGTPVSGVELEVTVPRQEASKRKTDGRGRIRFDDVSSGLCRVSASFDGGRASSCANFVDVGFDAPAPPPGQPKPAAQSKEPPPPKAIAILRQHRVRAKDTLASLAASVGLTWQQLAKFNWGTDDPDGINKHLKDDLGCWKKTADGKNYMFSDYDDPGVIVLPRKWSATDLFTTQSHYILVRRLAPPPRFIAWSL